MKQLKVSNGIVQGRIQSILGNDIVQFLSIPYCQPPIKELRLLKPQVCKTFSNEIINKLKFETCPPQIPLEIFNGENKDEETWIPKEMHDEDSLYVNIWCPLNVLEGKIRQPVLAWIYGGGFVSGSSSLDIYNGAILASQENIIVVSFNYRLSMLGFLCLDDNLISGNNGIWDQLMALKWINQNISVFNGNPDDVTIAGNSAGGCSVSLHLLIEESWPYFNKAIIQSGVCLSDWAFHSRSEMVRRSIVAVNLILDKFEFPKKWTANISQQDKLLIVEFLQTLHFKEFLIDSQLVDGILEFAWTPCNDGDLIKDTPRKLFIEEKFKKCPTIFLNVENEGTYFIMSKFPHIVVDKDKMVDIQCFNDCYKYYPYFPIICDDSLRENIKKQYNISGKKLSIDIFDKIISDQHFVCEQIELANIVSKSNRNVYYLWFNAFVKNAFWPEWCGVMHSEEVYYMFGNPIKSMQMSTDFEKLICRNLMKQFCQFIKQGNLDKLMPFYDELSKTYISIEGDNWEIKTFCENQFRNLDFWKILKTNIIENH